jgi:hypothetical protein
VALGLAGTLELWRGKRVVLAVGRMVEMTGDVAADIAAIETALLETLPAYTDPGGKRPWAWLTSLLR